jgi:hypothetical protein
MRKGLLLFACLIGAVGGIGVLSARNDCSFDPAGQWRIKQAVDAVMDGVTPDECDPWHYVKEDPSVARIEILPYSSWSPAPPRPVIVSWSGSIEIREPLDLDELRTSRLKQGQNRVIARRIISSLSRITRYNRATHKTAAQLEESLPEGSDMSDVQNYLVAPKMPCLGQMYDGGGVRLKVKYLSGKSDEIMLDSHCHSVAKARAIKLAWEARNQVYEALSFQGEHYNHSLTLE